MGRTGTQRLKIKKEGFELELERRESGKIVEPIFDGQDDILSRQESAFHRASMALSREKGASGSSSIPPIELSEEAAGVYVTSPMVGTFYNSPSPDDPSFVKVGDKIEKHSVVCIIEAMKVMNEVKAGVAGTIVEVLVESGHPVEFGTKLFRIT